MLPLVVLTHHFGIPLYFLFATWVAAAWVSPGWSFGGGAMNQADYDWAHYCARFGVQRG